MEITKIGESYKFTDIQDTYGIEGNCIKTLNGEGIFNINTHIINDLNNIISIIQGTYNPQNDTFQITINSKISKDIEQIDAIKLVLNIIKQLINSEL